jgi:hypothetical protein
MKLDSDSGNRKIVKFYGNSYFADLNGVQLHELVCMYVCMYICMCMCVDLNGVQLYELVCMYELYVCMSSYVCMYVCMCRLEWCPAA